MSNTRIAESDWTRQDLVTCIAQNYFVVRAFSRSDPLSLSIGGVAREINFALVSFPAPNPRTGKGLVTLRLFLGSTGA